MHICKAVYIHVCVSVYAIFRHNEEVYIISVARVNYVVILATISESWTRGEACSNTTTPASHTRISAYDTKHS